MEEKRGRFLGRRIQLDGEKDIKPRLGRLF